MKIVWAEPAIADLESIHEYIARDSKTYAARFIKSLIVATVKLEKLPFCGRLVPEFEKYEFREVIFRNYRIIYRVIENNLNVEILAVIHAARDIESVLKHDWQL